MLVFSLCLLAGPGSFGGGGKFYGGAAAGYTQAEFVTGLDAAAAAVNSLLIAF